MSDAKKIYGIDLGTTYSCIACLDTHGKPVVLKNSEGDLTTPSVVFFDEGDNVVIGKTAKENSKMYPDAVVSFVKRSMGDPNYLFGYQGKTYRAEEISAYILKKLVADAEQEAGEKITDVVITCPAYFGINEKEATAKAGEIAGLKVHSILAEPTAAAIAWGKANDENKVVLVYDLGGGTFDITMIEVSNKKIEVIVTGGDHNLGGKDWDDALIGYFADQYRQQSGKQDNILAELDTYQELQNLAENSKKTLSAREKCPASFIGGGAKIKTELTREKFNEITADLLERTISLTRDMLAEAAKKGFKKFDEILLVGGSTKMPQVGERLKKEFSVPINSFDPDEAVAKGAAIFGNDLMVNGELKKAIAEATGKKAEDIKDVSQVDAAVMEKAAQKVAGNLGFSVDAVKGAGKTITNVISKSFGTDVYDNKGNKSVCNLILKNTSLPCEASDEFCTSVNNQKTVLVEILENEIGEKNVPWDENLNILIGQAVLDIPPNMPAGSPLRVTFKLSEDGRLDMEAVELSQNGKIHLTIQTSSVINAEELAEAKLRSCNMKVS
ncbi:MAG: Hsp70 family protein [Acidaminococcales bacterium]|jgi:molecular chaperone DnaK (HSP70)|nr:Hsp70 family protein [Acidaminococcales bacterium]